MHAFLCIYFWLICMKLIYIFFMFLSLCCHWKCRYLHFICDFTDVCQLTSFWTQKFTSMIKCLFLKENFVKLLLHLKAGCVLNYLLSWKFPENIFHKIMPPLQCICCVLQYFKIMHYSFQKNIIHIKHETGLLRKSIYPQPYKKCFFDMCLLTWCIKLIFY